MTYCQEGNAISKVKMFNQLTFQLASNIRITLDKASVLISYRLETFNPLLIFFISLINAFPTSWKRKITSDNAYIFLSISIIIQPASRRLVNFAVLFWFCQFIGQDRSASWLSKRAKRASNERVQFNCIQLRGSGRFRDSFLLLPKSYWACLFLQSSFFVT